MKRLCIAALAALVLFGCGGPKATQEDFVKDVRELTTAARAWTKDVKNKDLLGKAEGKAEEVVEKYRDTEIAKNNKEDWDSVKILSMALIAAKSSPDPTQAPPTSRSSALELTNSGVTLLEGSPLLKGATPTP